MKAKYFPLNQDSLWGVVPGWAGARLLRLPGALDHS